MKEKILLFIIGVLVGAVISTGAFYVYTIANNNCNNSNTQMQGGTPPSMPSGQNNNENGQPPETPNSNNSQDNTNSTQSNN